MTFDHVVVRVHTVASFTSEGEGVDYRYEDMTVYDVTEQQAIEAAEAVSPRWRKLSGIEILKTIK
jgi:hypothetical protein